MDQGWDHTENEDKLLLAQTWALGQIKHTDVDIQVNAPRGGCSDNMGRSGGQELVSLSSEFGKHLSSVVLNNYNLLFGLSPSPFKFPLLFYYIQQLNCLYLFISKICDICNSDCKCTCTCSCKPRCKGNFICLCECNSNKGDASNGFCICICKKQQENGNCKCICICICKNGEKCCGTQHTCGNCLLKINLSILKYEICEIINDLRCIRWYISIIEKKCCYCDCCKFSRCGSPCCSPCELIIDYYKSIISRIRWIEYLFKQIGTKILKLRTLKNILSLISSIATKCKSCQESCCKDINGLTENIEKAGQYYSSFASVIADIKLLVYYKIFCPQANEVIERLKFSVKPLLNQLKLINGEIVGNEDFTGTSDKFLVVVYSHHCIFQSFLDMYILLQSMSKLGSIIYIIRRVDICGCVIKFQSTNGNTTYNISDFYKQILGADKNNRDDFKKLFVDKEGNHVCLCLVIKYVMHPSLIKSLYYLRYVYLEALGKQTRDFTRNKYGGMNINDMIKMLFLIINATYKISIYMKSKFFYFKYCFCLYHKSKYYPYLISIILFVSSMIENIWSMDTESIRMAIDKVSTLLSEYQSLHVYTNYGSRKSNNLEIIISGLYNFSIIKGVGPKNGSNGILYSGLSLKSKKFSFGNISGYVTSFMLINKLNLDKERLNMLYQIFSRLSFEINIKWTYTEIKINRAISMHASNIYILLLKQICSNPKSNCNNQCKCGVLKIYSMSILLIFTYSKLNSKMKINEEILYIIDLLKKNKFDEYIKLMKNIADDYINHNNMTIEYITWCLIITKNNLLASGLYGTGLNTNLRNISVRNWGYDTQYEHHVTNSRNKTKDPRNHMISYN